MSNITPDNFAEFSPNLRKHSAEAQKFGENAVVLPEKLSSDLKDLVKNQQDTGYSIDVIAQNDIVAQEKYQNNCYVYHRVPANMHGNVLYPLNRLKDIDEDLYNLYAEGYKDRQKLRETNVPILNCLWNDTLFFSPVHPQKLYDLAKEFGLQDQWRFKKFFAFKIRTNIMLDNAVVFYRVGKEMNAMVYRPAIEVKISELDRIPGLTRAYYESVANQHTDLFPYQLVPQLLYKGEVDTSNVKVIELV